MVKDISGLKTKLRGLQKLLTRSNEELKRVILIEKNEIDFMENLQCSLEIANMTLKAARKSNFERYFGTSKPENSKEKMTKRTVISNNNLINNKFGKKNIKSEVEESNKTFSELENQVLLHLLKKNGFNDLNEFYLKMKEEEEKFPIKLEINKKDELRNHHIFNTEEKKINIYDNDNFATFRTHNINTKKPNFGREMDYFNKRKVKRKMEKSPEKKRDLKTNKKRCFSHNVFNIKKQQNNSKEEEELRENILKEQKSLPTFEEFYGQEVVLEIRNSKEVVKKKKKKKNGFDRLKKRIERIVAAGSHRFREEKGIRDFSKGSKA